MKYLAGWLGACVVSAAVLAGALRPPAHAGDKPLGPDAKEVHGVLVKAVEFLKSQQSDDGSFSAKRTGPGVSALIVAGLVRNGYSVKDPLVAKTLTYIEKKIQKDGGIYDKFLANYTTSVAVMALKEANADGKYNTILANSAKFLRGIQQDESTTDLGKLNAGGFGYDKKSRPDLSNSAFAVEALLAAGLSKDDPAVKKALAFISRCQNLPGEFNDQEFAKKASKDDQGGFTYVPDPKDSKYATAAGGLRSLGGMTYGGLKSFLYAGVDKNDPRVKAAVAWVRAHYTLNENPGLGQSGLYYYYHTFAKAMAAWGEDRFADAKGAKHDWRRELFDALESRQQKDGSWRNAGDQAFGEADPNLATAFAVLTISYCQQK
jgi:hypothetical protein